MSGLNFDLSTGTISGLRLDYRIDDRHTRFVRGGIDNNRSLSGGGIESSWVAASNNYTYQTAMGLTSVLKPAPISDFRFPYS